MGCLQKTMTGSTTTSNGRLNTVGSACKLHFVRPALLWVHCVKVRFDPTETASKLASERAIREVQTIRTHVSFNDCRPCHSLLPVSGLPDCHRWGMMRSGEVSRGSGSCDRKHAISILRPLSSIHRLRVGHPQAEIAALAAPDYNGVVRCVLRHRCGFGARVGTLRGFAPCPCPKMPDSDGGGEL